jgi:hypothetical protein
VHESKSPGTLLTDFAGTRWSQYQFRAGPKTGL